MSDDSGERISPEPVKVHDGFPIVPAITFALEGASLKGAPSVDDIGASLKADSRTLVINADSGALVAHWAELDYLAEDAGKHVVQFAPGERAGARSSLRGGGARAHRRRRAAGTGHAWLRRVARR